MASWRYKLQEDWERKLPEWWEDRIKTNFSHPWFVLQKSPPVLVIRKGYAWDGCSGPMIPDGACRKPGPDSPSVLFKPKDCYRTTTKATGSHDPGYQWLELFKALGITRKIWDELFRDDLKADGFSHWKLYYWGVRKFGGIWHTGRKVLSGIGLI